MMSRWKIALGAAATAAAATLAVIAVSDRGVEPVSATVPDDSVPDGTTGAADPAERTVTVTGHGTVKVTPDIANVSMGVQATSRDADEVFSTLETKSTALVDTLKGLGVAEEDIRTSGLNLFPNYVDNNEITGYNGSVNVDVTLRDIARVGEILDGVRGFVGPELTLGGISFSYAEPETVLGDARVAAIENAKVRAGQFAGAADAELGEIVKIIESSVPTPIFAREFAQDAAAPSIAIEPGAQELAVDVTVVFAMS